MNQGIYSTSLQPSSFFKSWSVFQYFPNCWHLVQHNYFYSFFFILSILSYLLYIDNCFSCFLSFSHSCIHLYLACVLHTPPQLTCPIHHQVYSPWFHSHKQFLQKRSPDGMNVADNSRGWVLECFYIYQCFHIEKTSPHKQTKKKGKGRKRLETIFDCAPNFACESSIVELQKMMICCKWIVESNSWKIWIF